MARPSIERLEVRWLPSASPLVVAPNETVDQAQDLGTLSQPVEASGSIGNGPDGAADVTWYHFSLADSARVDLEVSTSAGQAPFASVVSLYNNDPQDFSDPYDVDGHRLLAQVEANPSDGAAADVQDLGPGDYFVAISGAGNLDFSPVIAGSGFDGATASYDLTISATDLGLSGDGPTVLSSDPPSGAVLDSSPLAIRLEMSGPLDPSTILAGQTVQLFSGTSGMVNAGTANSVALASVNFSATANELQLFPLAPLAPGNYVVGFAGDSSTDQAVLADPIGVPLGEDSAHLAGTDESFSFQVDGIDGVAGATGSDDTASTARNLGDVTGAGLIQVSGAIGDDPSFNPNLSPDPSDPEPQFIPANQVDLDHFQITGPGRYAMLAEVFAGRIGSPLDPGLSLYELDPSDGSLVFLAGNNNTLNPTPGTDGSIPLFTDSALTDGLTAGDYYLAVAGGSNTPSPLEGQMPGSPGIFNPNEPGSAQLGWSTGPYVLNVLVQPAPNPPQVVASSPAGGQVLDQPPTQITVRFSEPINIQQLAYDAFATLAQTTLTQVFIEGADGTKYYPRFESYNRATNQATFMMLDRLADGSYALHLSGPGGLTDLGSNPIVGNNQSGDYVIPFKVFGPDLAISGNMANGYTFVAQANQGVFQDLGVLFPDELQAGFTVIRGPDSSTTPASATTEDDYLIQVLQSQNYFFRLSGDNLPAGTQVTITDAAGQQIPILMSSNGLVFFSPLAAGTYTVAVGGWTAGQSASVSYDLTMDLAGQQNDAPPLVDGPAPLLQIHLDGIATTTVTVNPGSPGGETSGASSLSLAGLGNLGFAQNEAMGALTSLGVGPLGGVASEAGPGSAPTIQVALGLPATPLFSSLVSLVTLTQVISMNHDGEGIQAENSLEQPASDTRSGATMIDQAEVPGPPAPLLSAARPELALNAPVLPDGEGRPRVVEAAMPPSAVSVDVSPPPAPAVVSRAETEPVAKTWVTLLVITGAVAAAAFRGRRAVQGLKWRKSAREEPLRSAGPISRHGAHGATTITCPPARKNCALPNGLRRAAQPARWSRSRDAR
jgi:methionine-rich copper-binding protein CopC